MSRSQHIHTAWAWLKAELARELGQANCDRIFAEYASRAKDDKQHNERVDAPELIARLEARRDSGRADQAEIRRLEKRIARLRSML